MDKGIAYGVSECLAVPDGGPEGRMSAFLKREPLFREIEREAEAGPGGGGAWDDPQGLQMREGEGNCPWRIGRSSWHGRSTLMR
jgi:hypothetical protein